MYSKDILSKQASKQASIRRFVPFFGCLLCKNITKFIILPLSLQSKNSMSL